MNPARVTKNGERSRRRVRGQGRSGTDRKSAPKARRNEHHLTPRCRGGKDADNLVTLPEGVHVAWHNFFGHLTPPEAVIFVRHVMQPGKRWSRAELEELRWNIINGKVV